MNNLYEINDYKIVKSIVRYVGIYYSYEFTEQLSNALRDSLSRGQLLSKISAVLLTQKHVAPKTEAFFIGHWHGLLPLLFYEYGLTDSARGIELDEFWAEFSNKLNSHWNWKSIQSDADNGIESAKLVVNTSSEHMSDDWVTFIKPGTTVCAQSTDYKHPTHINTVESLEEFLDKWSGFTILEANSTKYDIYSRYTIVAIKL